MVGMAQGEKRVGEQEQGHEDGSVWGLESLPPLAFATQLGVCGCGAEWDRVMNGKLRAPGHRAFGPVKCWQGAAGDAVPWPLQRVGC